MTTKLTWRLGKLPTVAELNDLVVNKIITQDEAKQVLFKEEDETKRDVQSLEEEIKFLRTLVEKLSSGNQTRIVEVIKEVQKPWYQYQWYQPYQTWCVNGNTAYGVSNATNTITGSASTTQNLASINLNTGKTSFSQIETF